MLANRERQANLALLRTAVPARETALSETSTRTFPEHDQLMEWVSKRFPITYQEYVGQFLNFLACKRLSLYDFAKTENAALLEKVFNEGIQARAYPRSLDALLHWMFNITLPSFSIDREHSDFLSRFSRDIKTAPCYTDLFNFSSLLRCNGFRFSDLTKKMPPEKGREIIQEAIKMGWISDVIGTALNKLPIQAYTIRLAEAGLNNSLVEVAQASQTGDNTNNFKHLRAIVTSTIPPKLVYDVMKGNHAVSSQAPLVAKETSLPLPVPPLVEQGRAPSAAPRHLSQPLPAMPRQAIPISRVDNIKWVPYKPPA
jgi:hypothetical protein